MKYIITLLSVISLSIMAENMLAKESTSFTTQEQQTIAIVDKQLAAYNAQDIEAFAATYHDDVEIYTFPNKLQYKGKSILKERYGKKFARLKYLNAKSLKRIVNGRFLVDHELAESASKDKNIIDRSVKIIAAYEVVDGLIKRVTFMKE